MASAARPERVLRRAICAAHETGANPLFHGHTSLVDLRALETVDLVPFARLLAYLKKRRAAWSPMVSRQAVLHGGGLAHATVVGMFHLLRPGHPVVFFDDAVAAYDVVGAADVHPEIEGLRLALLGTPDVMRRVRSALEHLPSRSGIGEVARRLGMSVRSLQRHLTAAGSSLRNERRSHMLRTSERLLEDTDLNLDAIAAKVGASSASHLVLIFRQHRGTTPGAIREASRKARGSLSR